MLQLRSLKAKVLFPLVLASLACLGVALTGFAGMRVLSGQLDRSADELVPSLLGLGDINEGLGSMRSHTWRTVVYLYENTPERLLPAAKAREEVLATIARGERLFDAQPHTPEEARLYAEYRRHFAAFREVNDGLWAAVQQGDTSRIKQLAAGQSRTLDQARAAVHALVELKHGQADALKREGHEAEQRVARWLALASGAALLLALGIGGRVVAGLVRPMREMALAAKAIGQGDLSQEVAHRSRDELGELAESFRRCQAYIREVAEAAEALSRGDLSREVVPRSAEDLLSLNVRRATGSLRGLLEQTRRLTEAARAGELSERGDASRFEGAYGELVAGINGTLDATLAPVREAAEVLGRLAARDLTARMRGEYRGEYRAIAEALNSAARDLHEGMVEVSRAALEVSAAGGEVVRAGASMAQVAGTARQAADRGQQATGRMADAMERILASARGTADVVSDIQAIARSTQVVSVNASLQAVAAGREALGFGVVAREVRRLAERTRQSAGHTEDLLRQSVEAAEQGGALSGELQAGLAGVTSALEQVAATAATLAASGEAGVEEAGDSAAARLAREAAAMQRLVEQFRLT
jgi:methyl-accepting chemotaxis protein